MTSEEYRQYCARVKADGLRTVKLLEECTDYQPRPGWEVKGCHSCLLAEADAACAELRRRFGSLVPCLAKLGGR